MAAKGHEERFGVMETGINTSYHYDLLFVRIHKIIHLKLVNIIIFKVYLNKDNGRKNSKKKIK